MRLYVMITQPTHIEIDSSLSEFMATLITLRCPTKQSTKQLEEILAFTLSMLNMGYSGEFDGNYALAGADRFGGFSINTKCYINVYPH